MGRTSLDVDAAFRWTNKRIEVHGCNVLELRNGKAIKDRLLSENASLFQQLGLLSFPKANAAS